MAKPYTKIPLDQLNSERALARVLLKHFTNLTGREYFIRTFFVGPRPKRGRNGSRPASTRKCDAVAAKIAIYEIHGYSKSWTGRRYPSGPLVQYI